MLHDPEGLIKAERPLDPPHAALVTAVLAWKAPDLAPRDYEQIALQLTGHARAVAADVRRLTAALPRNDGRGALAEVVWLCSSGFVHEIGLWPNFCGAAGSQGRAQQVRSRIARSQAWDGGGRQAHVTATTEVVPEPEIGQQMSTNLGGRRVWHCSIAGG